MTSEQAKAAVEEVLRGISVQLTYAGHQLRSFTAMIKRTNQAIRSSREALVRTNTLVQPNERSDRELKRVG